MSFIGVTHKSMDEELLTGVEMTQNQQYHQSLPQHGPQLTKLGTWNTQHSWSSAGWRWIVLSRCLSWSKLLPDSWYEGGSFESLLCSSASFHLRGTLSFYCSLAGKESTEFDQFQGPFWDLLLPSCLRGFLSDGMKGGMVQCFNIGGNLWNWNHVTKDQSQRE